MVNTICYQEVTVAQGRQSSIEKFELPEKEAQGTVVSVACKSKALLLLTFTKLHMLLYMSLLNGRIQYHSHR